MSFTFLRQPTAVRVRCDATGRGVVIRTTPLYSFVLSRPVGFFEPSASTILVMNPQSPDRPVDVFVSVAHAQAASVRPMIEALRQAGMTTEVATAQESDLAAIDWSIEHGVRRAKLLLAWYSDTYPICRRCQVECTTAYLAGVAEGNAEGRIVAVNPEIDDLHVIPSGFRNQLVSVGSEGSQMADVIGEVQRRVAELGSAMGRVLSGQRPPWHGLTPAGSERFVGRYDLMWKIHGALNARRRSQPDQAAVVYLDGASGAGKSLLAEEYALRFDRAYPGGVFWLRAYGAGDPYTGMGAEEREAERDRQIRDFASALGVIIANRTPDEIRSAVGEALERRALPCLWIVDDLPVELSEFNLRKWLGPHVHVRTLVTTRRPRGSGAAPPAFTVGPLGDREGVTLLSSQRTPANAPGEVEAARALVRDLGGHPLALDLAGATLWEDPQLDVADLWGMLDSLADAAEPYGARIRPEVPDGREGAIAAVLLRAVNGIQGEGRDLLRLASVLTAAPITVGFFAAVLAKIRELPDDAAREAARRGIEEAELRLLTERTVQPGRPVSVHPLVADAVEFADAQAVRLETVRAAAVVALLDQLPRTYDPGAYSAVDHEIPHARKLVRRAHSASETELLGRVARYDLVRGAYLSGAGLYRRQFRANRELYGDKHPQTVTAMSNLAGACFVVGDLAGARKLQEDVVRIRRETPGEEHPDTLTAMTNLAGTLSIDGDLEGARRVQEEILAIRRRLHGPEHPSTTGAAWNLYLTLVEMHAADTARAVYEQHLRWMLDRPLTGLRAEQRKIRDALAEVADSV